MSLPILATKLNIPPTRPELVPRPHLHEKLNQGLHRKMTLVSAPAGFGKTTLVSKWVVGCDCPAAWLSLDEADNDPVHFLTYIMTALQRINSGDARIGEAPLGMLKSPQPPATQDILASLINEIDLHDEQIILILDDYHLVDASPTHEALRFLIENLPENMHIVISTREDPLLPLPRLRARDQLTELRAADLSFSNAEAAQFLNQVMGLNLSSKEISLLEQRTEGWIAGLQLAALSLQGRQDTKQLISSFSGSHRLVLDYLIEEVLEQQSETVRDFLLKTSILDRMTGSLCDALTGQSNGTETLEALDRANLFIIPLDEERNWYRYHHLFGDLIRQHLKQDLVGQLKILHLRASEWFSQNHDPEMAVEHALRAQDFDRSAALINAMADQLWQRGEHGKLRTWLERLPGEYISTNPLLSIFHGYYLHSYGQIEQGDRFLQQAEKLLEENHEPVSENSTGKEDQVAVKDSGRLRGRLAVVRALIATFSGDVPGMIHQSDAALDQLPEKDQVWRILAVITLGDAYSYQGDMAASYQARAEALRTCEALGDIYYTIISGLKLASTLREQGELKQTIDLCQEQLQLAEKSGFIQSSPVGCLMALLGDALAEMNRMDPAIQEASLGVEIAERGINLTLLGYSYLYMIRILFSNAEYSQARSIFQKVALLNQETTIPQWLTDQLANWQARFDLSHGDIDAAIKWRDHRRSIIDFASTTIEDVDFLQMFDCIILARIMIAQNQLSEARELITQLQEHAEEQGRTTRLIELLILHALTYGVEGNTDRAMIPLERAIRLSEKLGFMRIFSDEGQLMAQLLYHAMSRGTAPDYVQKLLAVFPITETEQISPAASFSNEQEFVEPLSEREIEVLELISNGLTNQEVAATLYLSLNTVKVHARNIYGKLGVTNRVQAVSRARSLGILPPI